MGKFDRGAVMRQDWDERARKDAFYYVATWRTDWTVRAFLESGEEDYLKLVQPVLGESQFALGDASMLEVGSGAGRMTGSFARRFAKVIALDISTEMLDLAKKHLKACHNIEWLLGDGTDLSPVASGSVDFVFCCLVLQHLPTQELVLTYVKEMLRVLKRGGVFLFQFNSNEQPMMNWKGRAVWSAIDRLREPVLGLDLRKAGYLLASLLGLDSLAAGRTWRGSMVSLREVKEAVSQSSGEILSVTGEGTSMTWCRGYRSG
jgi:SAM-dependent methyltransferase